MHKMPLELPRCLSVAFPLQALFLQQMQADCSLGVALGLVLCFGGSRRDLWRGRA